MAPKIDKSKSASSETIGGVEIGSVEHLAKTIERLQELQKETQKLQQETFEQTNNLSLIMWKENDYLITAIHICTLTKTEPLNFKTSSTILY